MVLVETLEKEVLLMAKIGSNLVIKIENVESQLAPGGTC